MQNFLLFFFSPALCVILYLYVGLCILNADIKETEKIRRDLKSGKLKKIPESVLNKWIYGTIWRRLFLID